MIKSSEINFLNQDELLYEVRVRGLEGTPTVTEMRTALRSLIRLSREGHNITTGDYPFTFVDDLKAIENKFQEIEGLMAEPKEKVKPNKITAKLSHTLGRCDRMNPTTEEKRAKAQWMLKLLTLIDSWDGDELERLEQKEIEENTSKLQELDIGSEDGANEEVRRTPVANSTSIPKLQAGDNMKPIPVVKWNIKFSGLSSEMSLNSFLQQVDDLRIARNVTKEQLFISAIDLFRGQALLWYRTKRKEAKDWDDLVRLLKEDYLPSDYDDKLLEEIRRRTQGPNETISAYIVVMENLFARLTQQMDEKTKLKIMLRNLDPFYQLHLGLTEVNSVNHLQRLGKQLEEKRIAVDNFVPPRRKTNDLEPDLAYVYVQDHREIASTSCEAIQQQRPPMKCWNCNKIGHTAMNCRAPRIKKCYKCGKPGYTVKTCVTCNSGNADARH